MSHKGKDTERRVNEIGVRLCAVLTSVSVNKTLKTLSFKLLKGNFSLALSGLCGNADEKYCNTEDVTSDFESITCCVYFKFMHLRNSYRTL